MEQNEFRKQLSELRTIIMDGIAYFSAWNEISNLSEDEAHALNRYRGFFVPAQLSFKYMALLQFAKLFDRDSRAVSFRNLLHEVKTSQELLVPYAEEGDLQKLEDKINADEELINHLKSFRDQRLAHHDSAISSDTSLKAGEVMQLVDDVKEIFNLLSRGHERSTTLFDSVSRDARRATSQVKQIMCEELDRATQRIQEAHRRIQKGD